ncbi:GntR family transcriptional regulator [Desulfovibrio sp. OttesenSCG-928-I05]|nr:GntR family transcriptional regulator [Desulfovibrio sp. OttesenSCG-928-I05]
MLETIERPQSLTELATERLRTAIVEGAFAMGQPLSENMLSRMLSISKTPIKQALTELRNEGLLVIVPQKGTYVFTITPEDLHLLSVVREALETTALRCAWDNDGPKLVAALSGLYTRMLEARDRDDLIAYLRLDAVFHQTMLEMAANDYLMKAYRLIASKTRAVLFHLADRPLQKRSFEDHGTLIGLLRDDKLAEAEALLRVHVHRHSHIDFSRIQEFGAHNYSLPSGLK